MLLMSATELRVVDWHCGLHQDRGTTTGQMEAHQKLDRRRVYLRGELRKGVEESDLFRSGIPRLRSE